MSERGARTTVGGYLAKRLEKIGLKEYFAIPGDYNLGLLDEILKNRQLKMVNCCNELNAGYAADGYARATGFGAVFTTFSVGALSAVNAITGAYAEDLPVLIVSGGPNTNSESRNEILHHTTGQAHYDYVMEMFRPVTCRSVIVRNVDEAPAVIDETIQACLIEKKPVYLEIPCNLAACEVPAPVPKRFDVHLHSDADTLAAAVEHAAEFLNAARKPVLVAGVKLRCAGAGEAFEALVAKMGCAFAAMPNAKGFVNERDPNYMGIYWGPVSDFGVNEIVESADAYLFAGPVFTDYTTTGYSAMIDKRRLVHVDRGKIRLEDATYTGVAMRDFLSGLAEKVNANDASLKGFHRIQGDVFNPRVETVTSVTREQLFYDIQEMLTPETVVVAETGDSWFNCMELKLPTGAGFEIQMQYGSIGWSVGAALGYAQAVNGRKRVVALIGDGSFQMTAQEVSTMIRYKLNPIIFLLNNRGYTIEVEIHDGPYNNIQNWDYAGLMKVFGEVGEGQGLGIKVETEDELREAISQARAFDGPVMIEVILDRDDCNHKLLNWGNRVAGNNSKPPAQIV